MGGAWDVACQTCGAWMPDAANFCGCCGSPVMAPQVPREPAHPRCWSCSAELVPLGPFCPACGAAQVVVVAPSDLGAPEPPKPSSAPPSGRRAWVPIAAAVGGIALVGGVAYAATSGGSRLGTGSPGGGSKAAAIAVLEQAVKESRAATSVAFHLTSRYEFTTSGGTMSGGSDLDGESDLTNDRSHATYMPVGFDADILQSLGSLGGSQLGDLSQGIEVVVADGNAYTRIGSGAWSTQLSEAVQGTAGDPTQLVNVLQKCQPISMSSSPGGGSEVQCNVPTDPATLAELGADLSGASSRELADADLSLTVSFGTTSQGTLEHVTSRVTGSVPEGSFTFDASLELSDWNETVSIQVPSAASA